MISNFIYIKKGHQKEMICVSKEEAKELRRLIPNVSIRRTMKGNSKRGKFYVVEENRVLNIIKKLREE